LEDAHRLKIIDYATFASLFLPFFEGNTSEYYSTAYVQKKLEGMADDNQRVEYIRARWIGLMSYKVSQVFMAQEQALLDGHLGSDLLHCLASNDLALLKAINDFSVKHIYNYRSVVEIELAGYNIIGGLLAAFVEAILKPDLSKSSKLLQLIPAQFKVQTLEDNVYKRIQTVVDYISGMTDLYAMDLYRKITGISIPEIK
jgi:dGTPase